MILTFAPFPALERVALTEGFVPGEPQKPMRVTTFAGGPGLRAASVIRLLGGETLALAFVGGRIGELLREALDRQDVPHLLTQTAGETRGNFLVLDREKGLVTLIPETTAAVTDIESDKLLASLSRHLVSASQLLLSGGEEDSAAPLLVRALEAAKAANIPVIADVKGTALPALLDQGGIELLRVSHKTLQRYTESSLLHDSAIVREAKRLREEKGVGKVVVTLGEEGALLVSDSGAWRVHAPVVSHFNPTGGGQTLIGAMAARLARNGGDTTEALRYGCAAASVNVTHDEPGYATPAEVAVLLPKTTVTAVNFR